ncbi:mutase [Lithospermum erythrorhizon]|uniref:Mutase n=1 Tax=Lithospermum erythrorhizon TaxID=34254 RepID=A0AAV3PFI4_LITER
MNKQLVYVILQHKPSTRIYNYTTFNATLYSCNASKTRPDISLRITLFIRKKTTFASTSMVNSEESKKRVAFILIDGVGDVSIPKLGFKTPLQAANIPNMDAIASAGVNGLMDPVEVGLGCGSDTAHLSLLGYDPRKYYRGRGAFESMGAGLAMSPGDIAFKSNFATLDEKTGVVTSRRADRHFEEEGPILCAALDRMTLPSFPEYEVRVRYATEHRCGVVVKGPKLSGNISGTDPLKDNRLLLQAEGLDDTEEAKHTARVVNELSKEMSSILVAHPINQKRASKGKNIANIVLLRGCGIRIEVPQFVDIHGLWPCMVAPTKIIAGLGMSLGLDILEAPGATGDYRTLLTSKATAIADALSAPLQSCPNVFVPGEDENKPGRSDGYDFGFLHIKAVDDAGHDKATVFKVKALEAVDKAIRQLARLLWQAESSGKFQYSICVTGDHSTPVEYGDHSFEPVPFTLCRLKDFVGAIGGEEVLMRTSLDPFPLPAVKVGEDLSRDAEIEETKGGKQLKSFNGDSVCEFHEIDAARGCLGRFPGSEMMGIIKTFLTL